MLFYNQTKVSPTYFKIDLSANSDAQIAFADIAIFGIPFTFNEV
jgi:hypothetical protein